MAKAVLIVLALSLSPWGLPAQENLPVNNSTLNTFLRPTNHVTQYWREKNGETFRVPFQIDGRDSVSLFQELIIIGKNSLPDTVFLYFSGVSSYGWVILNGYWLEGLPIPFGEALIPVPSSLIHTGINELQIKLSTEGPKMPFYPSLVCGIIGEVHLMVLDTIVRAPVNPERMDKPDQVIVYVPWSKRDGYQSNPAVFWKDLKLLSDEGVDVLSFPFNPPGKYLVMMKKAGFKHCKDWTHAKEVAFFNAYEAQNVTRGLKIPFWKDIDGNTTPAWGMFFDQASSGPRWVEPPSNSWLITFLVIPLLGIVVIKLFAGRIWDSMLEFVTKSKIQIELISKGKFLQPLESFLMIFFSLFVNSIMISLALYYVQCVGYSDWLNVLTTDSWLFQAFSGAELNLPQYFVIAFLFASGFRVLKYVFLFSMSLIYRLPALSGGIQNLDVLMYYPLNLVLILPVIFLFYTGPDMVLPLVVTWLVLFTAIFIRKQIIGISALRNVFGMPVGLKILYIWGFEILPWIILL